MSGPSIMESDAAHSDEERPRLDPEMFNPDRVLDIAYCVFVASTSSRDHPDDADVVKIAKRVVEDFHRMCDDTAFGTADRAFLFTIQQIITSLARGIIRRKHVYEQMIQMAEEKKIRQISHLASQSNQVGIVKAAWRALLLGGLGFALVRLFYPDLHIDGPRDSNFASLASAITFILGGTFFRSWNMHRGIVRIFSDFDHEQLHANIIYQQSALEEYLRAEEAACRAWEKFTGRKPLRLPGFERVLAEELRRNKAMERHRERLAQGSFSRTLRVLARLGIRRREDTAAD